MAQELEYFGTRENPTNIAEDSEKVLDVTIQNELYGLRGYFISILDELKIDPKQPAVEYKIEGLANDKVRNIINPVIAVLDNKIKGAK